MKREHKLATIATLMIFTMSLASVPQYVLAANAVIGPHLVVVTIPQDDQKREKGIIVLGLTPDFTDWDKPFSCPPLGGVTRECVDFISQHKILVTFNGRPLVWETSRPDKAPKVTCNVLEKDKVHPIHDKFSNPTSQFPQENLKTVLLDVSDLFKCKVRWKNPLNNIGFFESVGVLDVYFVGDTLATFIADNILVVNVQLTKFNERAVDIKGTDIQDICVLGWSMGSNHVAIPKMSTNDFHDSWDDPLGPFVSCEEAALWQRDNLGVLIQGVTN